MSQQMAINSTLQAAGRTLQQTQTLQGNIVDSVDTSVNIGTTGTLTVRTDNANGTLTLASGHGVSTGDIIDLFWTLGGVDYFRSSIIVGTVSGNSAPISSGSGNVLPAASTAIMVGKRSPRYSFPVIQSTFPCLGLGVYSQVWGCVAFFDASNTVLGVLQLGNSSISGVSYFWFPGCGYSSPIGSSDVNNVTFSHTNTSSAQSMIVAALR
jgi:hypothetical protein